MFSVSSIARACFGARKDVVMALFTYLDCSGDSSDPATTMISAGGFIAPEENWIAFERSWRQLLIDFQIPEFHMVDFAQSAKGSPFEHWKDDEPKRRAFISEAGRIINNHTIESVGATLWIPAYESWNRRFRLEEELGLPYTVAMNLAIAKTIDWCEKKRHSEPLIFIIEKGDSEQGNYRNFWAHFEGKWDIDFVTSPIFQKKRWTDANGVVQYCLPFQSSDFVCYEQAKAATDFVVRHRLEPRQSFRQLKTLDEYENSRMWTLMEYSGIGNAVRKHKVAPRPEVMRRTGQ